MKKLKKLLYEKAPRRERPFAMRLMLDSGAYTAWTKGVEIDVDRYADFVLENQKYITVAVNLDTLPGKKGKIPSDADAEEAARLSFDNLIHLRDRGVNVIPVFHQGERFYWLDKMLGEGFDYIGLSPNQNRTHVQRYEWVRNCFSKLCGNSPYTTVKTHGFGFTSFKSIRDFPWYSLDSTSWIRSESGHGIILVPRTDAQGNYVFRRPYSRVAVTTDKFSQSAWKNGNHINQLGKRDRDYVEKVMADAGADFSKCHTSSGNGWCARATQTAWAYTGMVLANSNNPFTHRVANTQDSEYGADKMPWNPMHFYFGGVSRFHHSAPAQVVRGCQAHDLNNGGILVSYMAICPKGDNNAATATLRKIMSIKRYAFEKVYNEHATT